MAVSKSCVLFSRDSHLGTCKLTNYSANIYLTLMLSPAQPIPPYEGMGRYIWLEAKVLSNGAKPFHGSLLRLKCSTYRKGQSLTYRLMQVAIAEWTRRHPFRASARNWHRRVPSAGGHYGRRWGLTNRAKDDILINQWKGKISVNLETVHSLILSSV